MPTSLQEPAPGSKSAQFVGADPLDPMIRPFQGVSDEQDDVQAALAENVNKRIEKAMEELKEKHRTGTNELDDPDRAPTGPAYQQVGMAAAHQQALKRQELARQKQEEEDRKEAVRRQVAEQMQGKDESDDDEDYDAWLEEDDPTLDALRERRLEEIRRDQIQKAEDLAKGHGEYRTIAQDDFLPECTGTSEFVAVHFFHREFARCEILDHHLRLIAPIHTSCKFLRIDAEKAPFFVTKLQIRTLPALIVFQDGKEIARLTGFEGLAVDPAEPDKWETRRLQDWLSKSGAIEFKRSGEELREDLERMGLQSRGPIYRGGVAHADFDEY